MMKKNEFESTLASMVLSIVKDPSSKGRVSRLVVVGHFNGRVFNPAKFLKQNFMMLVRILVNLSMELTEKEFLAWWNDLGRTIYDFGDSSGDTFNSMHQRKNHNR